MASPIEQTPSTGTLRRLTIAVWALIAVLIVNPALQVLTQFVPFMYARQFIADQRGPSSYYDLPSSDPFANFDEWPLEKQVQSASAIVLTKFTQDGPRIKSTIAEILKRTPDTIFAYHIGDEYARGSRYVRANTTYGDGEVIFFTGSPTTMRYSSTYENGRLLGMGDLPLDVLRQTIASQVQAPSK